MEDQMENEFVDDQNSSLVIQMFQAFGGVFFKFLKKIGVARMEGVVDTWDD
jgi:hypothetical protein